MDVSHWVVAAIALNVAFVATVIVFAFRIPRQNAVDTDLVYLKPGWRSPALERLTEAAPRPIAAYRSADMTRAEWRALLDSLDAAHRVYLRELKAWHTVKPRVYGALTQAKHDLEVAKRRLACFERELIRPITPRSADRTASCAG
jgi:hypothetical protein